ncbi:hypothetical protein BU25DRAFT_459484 [Macroventuria anomochaeta]|uniref:Uncharacterized protein n=1 Tax=Macroventuria anomochaeta TaxID=301207 RepID=A0ACB6RZN1_9PLEO|nr:uncharacterized protein BU25DRAFT_459484 [Macroventuria anomochaeta]KAF2626347.1 hypothetical protein BU25DRAFT_459484 [Macroventuria anomochaeta]
MASQLGSTAACLSSTSLFAYFGSPVAVFVRAFLRPDAPSWSWLGWSGKLDFKKWRCNTDAQLPPSEVETTITSLVNFFKKTDRFNGTSSRVDNLVRIYFTVSAGTTPDGWQKHNGDVDSNYESFYAYLATTDHHTQIPIGDSGIWFHLSSDPGTSIH